MARNFHRVWCTGVDVAEHAVHLSRKEYDLPNLSFVHGTAESLMVLDNSIDVVLAVESSHALGNVKKFLSEVLRVLKPGGHLLLTDLRDSLEEMESFREELMASGLLMINHEDITVNVLSAIESDDAAKRKTIESLVPKSYQKVFFEVAAVVGSRVHQSLRDGSGVYHRYVLQKPEARL
ncbi:hypothetical protein DQQ10_00380 [Pseudochryseolinea flava]|uniref:Methyltransferase type 11 domain-containing protein n=1 Tax=Pseudochryseolinea flava TaxID=2059302 RepID=A0A364Y6K8_9BACT|nr:hypothetical protein DQQ10_00380 [Pseudochryseolinea flava]